MNILFFFKTISHKLEFSYVYLLFNLFIIQFIIKINLEVKNKNLFKIQIIRFILV
jgi:hypothetical protein